MSTSYSWEGKGRYGSFRLRIERVDVQVKVWDSVRTRHAIPERFRGDDSRTGAIWNVRTCSFTFTVGSDLVTVSVCVCSCGCCAVFVASVISSSICVTSICSSWSSSAPAAWRWPPKIPSSSTRSATSSSTTSTTSSRASSPSRWSWRLVGWLVDRCLMALSAHAGYIVP